MVKTSKPFELARHKQPHPVLFLVLHSNLLVLAHDLSYVHIYITHSLTIHIYIYLGYLRKNNKLHVDDGTCCHPCG